MITCDVIKAAYRQTKDGYAITFVIHPQDEHDQLSKAPIGSQFNMKLVPLDEHGNARLRDSQDAADQTVAGEAELQPSAWDNSSSPPPSKQRKPVAPEKRLAQQAGICCADPVFRAFLGKVNEIMAADIVREYCNVKSRSEILPGTQAGLKWEELHGRFIGWRDHDMPAGEAA